MNPQPSHYKPTAYVIGYTVLNHFILTEMDIKSVMAFGFRNLFSQSLIEPHSAATPVEKGNPTS